MTASTTTTSPPRRKPTAGDIGRCVLVTAASGPAAWLGAMLLSHVTLGSHERIGTIVLAVLALGAAVTYSLRSWAWSGIFLSGLLLLPAALDRRFVLLGSAAIPMLAAVAVYWTWLARRISGLLAEAQANDSKENWRVALTALDELLKLDPIHTEAIKLRGKVWGYYGVTLDLGGGVTMNFVSIPEGEFRMGSPLGEAGRGADETQHKVKLTRPFYMQTTPVTQAQWEAVMGNNPSNFRGDDLPVEQVSWSDAVAFCEKLSQKDGRHYRLPTEAEWEYACRAGTTTRFYTGDDDQSLDRAAWYGDNSGGKTHPVGQKQPNAFGLYDMHGNVWQWCYDVYENYPAGPVSDPTGPVRIPNSRRVLRGGSWFDDAVYCRSAGRDRGAPDGRYGSIGFRVVLDSP